MYEMESYRNAYNERTFKKVTSYEYDNNMFNFEDPKVLRRFTKSEKSSKKHWRKSYGFKISNNIRRISMEHDNVNIFRIILDQEKKYLNKKSI